VTIAPSTAARAADSLLAALDPEQRVAAALPDGPAQIIAPAGSGKTTTLIARLGVLLGRGVPADRIGVVTFNRDAAAELAARIASRLAPHVPGAAAPVVCQLLRRWLPTGSTSFGLSWRLPPREAGG
jgi:superfamily I DNA/RNA helicase